MAIKSKNIQYKSSFKLFLVGIIVLLLIWVANMGYIVLLNQEAFFSDDFYETEMFQQNYLRLSHNVVEKQLDLVDEDTIRKARDPETIESSLLRLSTINDNIKRASSFQYVFINSATGETITNIDAEKWKKYYDTVEEYIKRFPTVVQWDKSGVYFPSASKMSNQPFINQSYFNTNQFGTTNVSAADVVYRLRGSDWLYYTAVNYDLIYEDILFGNNYTQFREAKIQTNRYVLNFIFICIALFIILVQLSFVSGKEQDNDDAKLVFYDYIPLEIQTLVSLLSFLPFKFYFDSNSENMAANNTRLFSVMLLGFFFIVTLTEFLSLVRLIKTKYIMRNPLVFKLLRWFIKLVTLDYGSPIIKIRVGIVVLSYIICNGALGYIFRQTEGMLSYIAIGAFVFINLFVFGWVLLLSKEITSLVYATKKHVEGEVDYPIYEEHYIVGFKGFAKDLNALQNGLQLALKEAIKGEKLKTELITNVSHDLKNPLTSIVSYLDLLDKKIKYIRFNTLTTEETADQEREIEAYLSILNDKSFRLKTLIEDLVSASKASSGNMDVDLQIINIRQLIQQCVGEKEKELTEQNLDLYLLPHIQSAVYGLVDPNHMYRVFDNLLSNIVKYSLEGTRVYIHIEEISDKTCIIFKNISNHPLEIDACDLKKRFIRGDKARTSEGSGLGLSIVESLLELQDGKLELSVDGDLFKATVCIVKASPVNVEEEDFEKINEQVVQEGE